MANDHTLRTYDSILGLAANADNPTPIVRLNKVTGFKHAQVYGKLEWFNPFGAVKDRIAANLIKDGEDRGVLGLSIRVNSLVGTVIGVMPPDMRFPNNTDLWIPAHMLPPESRIEERDGQGFQVIGRVAPGSSIEAARGELAGIGRRLADQYPEANEDLLNCILRFGPIRQQLPGHFVDEGAEPIVELGHGLFVTSGDAMHEHPVLLAHSICLS